MPLFTDREAQDLAAICPEHKIILDGPGLIALVQSACTMAYKIDDLIHKDPELFAIAKRIGLAMHAAEIVIAPDLKLLAQKASALEYGTRKL